MTSRVSGHGHIKLDTMVKALERHVIKHCALPISVCPRSLHCQLVFALEACTAKSMLQLFKVKLLQGDSRIAGADVSPVQAWHPAM